MLHDIVLMLSASGDLAARITLTDLTLFLDTVSRYLGIITLRSPRTHSGLSPLPLDLLRALSAHTALPKADIEKLWRTFGSHLIRSPNQWCRDYEAEAQRLAHVAEEIGIGEQ